MTVNPFAQSAAARDVPALPGQESSGSEVPSPDGALSSAQLLQGRKVVQIEHNGSLYMLRTTRLGKLILTK